MFRTYGAVIPLFLTITLSCVDTVNVPLPSSTETSEPTKESDADVESETDAEIDPSACIEEFCDGLDNDCDGLPDEELICSCSEDNSCYGGPPITQNIGECQNGTRQCDASGEIWEACEAWTPPANEVCDSLDNDCDGQVDEDTVNACGTCGDVPAESCDGLDNDCDGSIDEGTLNACDRCGELPEELCDEIDNDCDGQSDEGCNICDPMAEICDSQDNDCDGLVDESVLNACGVCGDTPTEVCDQRDNDCDGQIDESVLNACGTCGAPPQEICDNQDNDCDGSTDEGVLNACGACGPAPQEVCDRVDNDCDGTVDEEGCVVTDIDINGDCITVSCPPNAPYPISCDIRFQGSDPRGCVAYNPGDSDVYLQEGNDCGAGRVRGTLTCSNIEGGRLNANNCPMNKTDTSYPRRRRGCADTD